jgi:hypothetical protein
MDPVSLGLLAALAGGAGGEVGRQAWAGLSDIVRRPFHRTPSTLDGAPEPAAMASGETELAALAQAPDDRERARALRDALALRAASDEEFAEALEQWHRRTAAMTVTGTVNNTIGGGTQNGPVLQGRDIFFTMTSAPPRDASGPGESPPDGGSS